MPIRSITLAACAVILAGCNYKPVPEPSLSARDAQYMAMVPKFEMDLNYERYQIDDPTNAAPGTITVDTKQNFLYLSQGGGKAIRYGIASGAEAFGWTGVADVRRMAEWPHWMPPADMLERWPHLKPTAAAGGLPGGADNPLGARALYLFQGNKDTLYRIHGTNEPETIGRGVSSGCIRMRNVDVIDLYNRVKLGTKVVVK